MSELEKYIVVTFILFFWLGALFLLGEMIPQLIDRALPL